MTAARAVTASRDPVVRVTGDPVVRVAGLRKTFGAVVAIADVSLELRPGETLALLGPSGCGKTTLLRMIAGLESPDAGTIEIGGQVVEGPGISLPPERRRLGMVFQDIALFPHLTVAENVAYGIRDKAARAARVAELLELVGLPDSGARRPHELSGGMQQRIALARALAPRPDVVLLDEPFANLDLTLRTQLRGELRRILDATGSSAILVTHDQGEALTLADRVAVMRRGAIDQVDTPERVYTMPATPFVATFVGVANLLGATVEDGRARTTLGLVTLIDGPETGRVLVVVRPEHVDLEPAVQTGSAHAVAVEAGGAKSVATAGSALNPVGGAGAATPGRIVARRFAGAELHYEIRLDDAQTVWVEAGTAARHLTVGAEVVLILRPVETVAFAASGERPG